MVTAFSISIPRENSKGSEGRKKKIEKENKEDCCAFICLLVHLLVFLMQVFFTIKMSHFPFVEIL
jgi:hypothetical protein